MVLGCDRIKYSVKTVPYILQLKKNDYLCSVKCCRRDLEMYFFSLRITRQQAYNQHDKGLHK